MVGKRSVWPIDREPDPDGRFALHLALQEESAARKEYTRRPENPHEAYPSRHASRRRTGFLVGRPIQPHTLLAH